MATTFEFRKDEVGRPLTTLIVVLVLVALVVALFLVRVPSRARLNLKPFERLGDTMGEQVAAMAGNGGTVALWQLRGQGRFHGYKASIRRFKEALVQKGARLIAVEEEVRQASPPLDPAPVGGGLTGDKFLALVNKYHDVRVLVLFGATPRLTDEQLSELPPRRPKIFLVTMYGVPPKALFEKGVVQKAIIPRIRPPIARNSAPPDPDRWFQVVDAEDVSALHP